MTVILHIGAHRCATATFQHYMRRAAPSLGLGFWGPEQTRAMVSGVMPGPAAATGRNRARRARGRVRIRLAQMAQQGATPLVVSDAGLLGRMGTCLGTRTLYAGAGERMARLAELFDPGLSDVVINIRSPDAWWASALSCAVSRGHALPEVAMLDDLAQARRSWKDVITDVACAMPGVRLWVLPFETFAGRPDAQLETMIARTPPRRDGRVWIGARPRLPQLREITGTRAGARLPSEDGRWMPFGPAQVAQLRSRYSDDLAWLETGADGLAWLMNDPDKTGAGLNPFQTDMTRGKRNDDERRLARDRRG